jgi:1-acyl-sn-glycerol-3-phosphate acyltransferase
MRHLPLRGRDADSVRTLLKDAAGQVGEGRSILIFPEGTRRAVAPWPEPDYESGAGALYRTLGIPCLPVALNSGCFWRRNFIRCPGVIEVEIQPAIPPGLPRPDFVALMTERIETASRRLTQTALAGTAGSGGASGERPVL